MKNLFTYLLVSSVLIACNQNRNQDEESADNRSMNNEDNTNTATAVSLEKVWQTDTLMTTSESVLYDEERNVLYVSNINGKPDEKDGNGFISSVNLQGEVIEPYMFSGYLDAPKGMGLKDDKLYVTNIDQLVEIDVNTKVSTNTWPIDTAQFLNDVAVGEDGTVYFSDSRANTIYALSDGQISVFLQNDELNGPNGLYATDSSLLVATMNSSQLLKINMNDKSNIEVISDGIGAGDGLVPVNDNTYLVSSWNGEVFYVDDEGNRRSILDTQKDEINSADIEYVQEENLLLVPTFFDNRIVAYRLTHDNSAENSNPANREVIKQ